VEALARATSDAPEPVCRLTRMSVIYSDALTAVLEGSPDVLDAMQAAQV
jgi:hypothetical protein